MSEIQFQKTPYGIAASLVDGEKITFGVGRTHAEAEENLRERLSEPSPPPTPAPASEAQAPAVPDDDHSDQAERDAEELANTYYKPHRFGDGPAWYAACVAACRELAQLRARVAILDAQEVELPELPSPTEEQMRLAVRLCNSLGIAISGVAAEVRVTELLQRERQLLDALRAVQAWREVAQKQNDALRDVLSGNDLAVERKQSIANWRGSDFRRQGYAAIAAYDALVGKDGE